MYIVKPPYPLRMIYPSLIWRFSVSAKMLFITFDDGPVPFITPWILDTLKSYGAKATFFCVGENVTRYPEIYHRILSEGHTAGNHTYNHLNGWKTRTAAYLDNITKCSAVVKSNLFRPPYGKLKRKQIRSSYLHDNYRIIMWDVLSYDYDQKVSPEKCLQNVLKYAREGSVIVFHDNIKAEKNLRYTLPQVLEYYSKKGFTFCAIASGR